MVLLVAFGFRWLLAFACSLCRLLALLAFGFCPCKPFSAAARHVVHLAAACLAVMMQIVQLMWLYVLVRNRCRTFQLQSLSVLKRPRPQLKQPTAPIQKTFNTLPLHTFVPQPPAIFAMNSCYQPASACHLKCVWNIIGQQLSSRQTRMPICQARLLVLTAAPVLAFMECVYVVKLIAPNVAAVTAPSTFLTLLCWKPLPVAIKANFARPSQS